MVFSCHSNHVSIGPSVVLLYYNYFIYIDGLDGGSSNKPRDLSKDWMVILGL